MSHTENKGNVTPLEEPKSIQAQASAWLAKLDSEAPSEADLLAFKQWVNQDHAHIAAFKKVSAAWDELNILTRLPLVRQQRELHQRELHQQQKAPKPWLAYVTKPVMGAVTAMLLAGLFMVGLQQNLFTAQQATYITAVGEQKTIILPDNSQMQLNTNSRIKFDYRGEVRAVYLYQGEAHFTVAKNPERPFEVYAGVGRVRAVGTAFSVMVNNNSSDINVMVTEGIVEIAPEIPSSAIDNQAANNKSANTQATNKTTAANHAQHAQAPQQKPLSNSKRVGAGSTVVFNQSQIQPIQQVADQEMQRRLAWQQGLLIFSGESLEEVVAQVSRYTDTKIIIKSEAARTLRIGGQFQATDIKAIFSALEKGFGIKADYATSSLVYLSYK